MWIDNALEISSTLALLPWGSRTGENIFPAALLVILGESVACCVDDVDGFRMGEPLGARRPFEGDGATLGTGLVEAATGPTVTDVRRAGLIPSPEPETLVAVDLVPASALPLVFFCQFFLSDTDQNKKKNRSLPAQSSFRSDIHPRQQQQSWVAYLELVDP